MVISALAPLHSEECVDDPTQESLLFQSIDCNEDGWHESSRVVLAVVENNNSSHSVLEGQTKN